MVGSTAANCPASPMDDCTACGSWTTSWPKTRRVPASGLIRVALHRTKVVLPAPLGPSTARIEPCSATSSKPSSAVVSLNRLTTPVASIMCVIRAPLATPPSATPGRGVGALVLTRKAEDLGVKLGLDVVADEDAGQPD